MDTSINFIHLPKTGGRTFRMKNKYINKMHVLHFPNSFKNFDKNKTYFTILRNPNERMYSEWCHYKNFTNHNQCYYEFFNEIKSLEDFINNKFTHNSQTKLLSGYSLYSYNKDDICLTELYNRIENDKLKIFIFEELNYDYNPFKNKNKPKICLDIFTKANKLDQEFYDTIKHKYKHKILNFNDYLK